MGWTYTHRPKGQSIKDFFSNQFNYDRGDGRYGKVLECSANLRVAYMAYEVGCPGEEKRIIALVCLIHHSSHDVRYNFGYKDMEESMGPVESSCPEEILRMLTPTEEKYALDWRERCWNRIKEKAKNPKLEVGMVIKTASPITFSDGSRLELFVVKSLRPFRLVQVNSVWYSPMYAVTREHLNKIGYSCVEKREEGERPSNS